jgi:flagellar basal-body rod protein FlgB
MSRAFQAADNRKPDMPISDIPLFSMLRTRMHWHQQRQNVLANNVANADMPSFRPRDLVPPRMEQMVQTNGSSVNMARTSTGHISGFTGTAGGSQFQMNGSGYEARPSGNSVDLEDEMIKVAANQMDFQAATTLYTRSLNLLKTALGKR